MNAPSPKARSTEAAGSTSVEVNIAKTFLASTQELSMVERARVFDFMSKFMSNPAHPGLSLERVQNTTGEMWSARVTQGLRAILHRSGSRNTLLYAGQHDDAYHWAERRRVEHHPQTGTLQIVETSEVAEELLAEEPESKEQPGLFDEHSDDYLLSLGLPKDWLPTIRRVRFEDQVLTVIERLPEEVGERLLSLASGELVTPPTPVSPDRPLTENPDHLRRFWVVQDAEELRDVLSRPLTDWVKFLHPSQRKLVEGEFRGAVKVTGAAGTGKTVVALHRARELARQGCSVFLTSYVSTLCRNLHKNMQILCSEDELSRIKVGTIHHRALVLARQMMPDVRPLESKEFRDWVERFRPLGNSEITTDFLISEWYGVIEPHGITSWEEYRSTPRQGRQNRLSQEDRFSCWQVFEALRREMETQSAFAWEQICEMARLGLATGHLKSPFDAVIVDEVQDLAPSALRLIAELSRDCPHNLLLVGDAGQRIYPGGFSLRKLGIDVRGRSHILRINYRTTEQIRRFADRLLPEMADDLDNDVYHRRSQCLLHGPQPQMHAFPSPEEEDEFVVSRVQEILGEGIHPEEIAIFARTGKRLDSLRERLDREGLPSHFLSRKENDDAEDAIRTGTMHRAKGLEFKVVFAIDCGAKVLPHERALADAENEQDRDEILARERQLLYVTLTRARDEAYITWNGERTPFLAETV